MRKRTKRGAGFSKLSVGAYTFLLVAGLIPPGVIHGAAGFVTLDSFSGKSGVVIHASGGGYTSGETVNIYLGTTTTGTPAATANAGANTLFGPTAITIPVSPTGPLTITAVGATSGVAASNTYYVVPFGPTTISVSGSGNNVPASVLQVSGNGFGPGEAVTIRLKSIDSTQNMGTATASTTADASGNFTNVTFTIPVVPANTYTLHATGQGSATDAYALIYIGGFFPGVFPSSYYILPGQALSFSGTGFAPGETITASDNSNTTISTFAVNASGTFANAGTFTVPINTPAGAHTYTLTGSVSAMPQNIPLTIGNFAPILMPSAYNVAPGDVFVVTGTGFAPGEEVSITVTGNNPATKTVDALGTFTTSPIVAVNPNATITITATGESSGSTATVPVTVGIIIPPANPATLNVSLNIDNTAGGTATAANFVVNVTGAMPGSFVGNASGTATTVTGGTAYTINVFSSQPNYTPQMSGNCAGPIAAGATDTCTVTETFALENTTATSTSPAQTSTGSLGGQATATSTTTTATSTTTSTNTTPLNLTLGNDTLNNLYVKLGALLATSGTEPGWTASTSTDLANFALSTSTDLTASGTAQAGASSSLTINLGLPLGASLTASGTAQAGTNTTDVFSSSLFDSLFAEVGFLQYQIQAAMGTVFGASWNWSGNVTSTLPDGLALNVSSTDTTGAFNLNITAANGTTSLSENFVPVIVTNPTPATPVEQINTTATNQAPSTPSSIIPTYIGTTTSGGGGGGGGGGGASFSYAPGIPNTGIVLGASTAAYDRVTLISMLANLRVQLATAQKKLVIQQIKENNCSFTFGKNLSQGITNAEVKKMQQVLNMSGLTQVAKVGAGSPGNESMYFGAATKKAVMTFQNIFADEILKPAGLNAANGYVGAGTRAKLNTLCATSVAVK